MSPSLSNQAIRALLGTVPSAVITRGRDYFADDAVSDVEIISDIAYATVIGSEAYGVVVSLDASLREKNQCTCRYFEGFGPCKHMVAVLCEIHAFEYQWANPPDGEPARLSQGTQIAIGNMLVTVHDPQQDRASNPPQAKPLSRWRERLAAIASQQRLGTTEGLLPDRAEMMYILDPAQDRHSEQLSVEVAYRVPLNDGRWSVVKRLGFQRHHLPQLPTEQDRQALAILMGSPIDTFGYGYDTLATLHRPFSVPDAAHRLLFDIIGPTGRCYLRRNGQKDDVVALQWDGGAMWQPGIHVIPDQPSGDYRLAMMLQRGDDALPIHEPQVLTGGGVMVHQQVLSRVQMDQPGQAAWVRAERSSGQARLRHRAGQDVLTIPRDEAAAMLEQLLSLPALPAISLPDELAFDTVSATPRPRLIVTTPDSNHWDKRLIAQMLVGYGEAWLDAEDHRAGVFDTDAHTFIKRDPAAEQAFTDQLLTAGLKAPAHYDREHHWHFVLQPKQLPDIAAALTQAGWLVEADAKPFRTAAELNLTVTSGIDWFELHGEAHFGDQTATLPDLLKAMRSGSRIVQLDDGSHGMLPEDWLTRYGLLGEFGKAQDDHLRFALPQAILLDAMLADLPGVDIDRQFKQVRERIKHAGKAKPKAPPRTFKGELRPYQRDGLGWMHQLNKLGLGGCLADDMGLGKTIQVLALLEARRTARPADRPEHPSLVVVPKSLVFNWKQEAQRFTPTLRVFDHTGKERFVLLGLSKDDLDSPRANKQLNNALHQHDLVLTTYGTLRRDIALLKDIPFDYAVLDEAQAIKNANTASAKAARLLRADHRLALSGTPIENHLGELWSLFGFINPGMLGHGKLGKQLQSNASAITDDTRQVLSRALRPYILRRTKAQVAADLPDKTEQTLYCELPPKQRKHYNQLRDHYRDQLLGRINTHGLAKSKIQVLEALLRLRQAACHPGLINKQHHKAESAKLDQLVPQLLSIIDEGHKALVFSQFTQFLDLLRKRIDPMNINYEYLDGKTRNRQDKVERFQDDPDCKLFLISLKAGGTGLNLTAADYVFLLDPWWNPAVEAQAIDRTHRIGQDKHVFAYRLIAKDTVEEKVIELQQTKRELADAIIGQDNATLRDLTREDLELLLG